MNHAARAQAALERVAGWRVGDASLLDTLGGGPASDCYLVEHRGRRYALRIDRPLAATLGLDRDAELAAHRAAAEAGLAPAVVAADPAAGVLLTRFVAGRTWRRDDLDDPDRLQRLGERLRTLHALRPVAVPDFDPAAALRRYACLLETDAARRLADEGAELLARIGGGERGLCHNDLTRANVIEARRLWLIDFEYAALGDPLFDLAVTAAHHGLGADARSALLRGRYGVDGERHLDALALHCALYERLLALWNAVVADATPKPG